MEEFIKSQVAPTLKYLPSALVKSYFSPRINRETDNFAKKTGFIKGICHPRDNYEQIKSAGLEWIRIDIPFPYNPDGSDNPHYQGFKEKCKRFKDNGLKVMAVSPYPEDYIECGMDPRDPANYPKVEEIARFLITDMQGYIDGLQITNEMGIPRFTLPLKMNECVDFIGRTAKAMAPLKGDIVVGYNSAGPQTDLHVGMKPYLQYIDWVGIDIYMGCFFFGTMWLFDALLRYLWNLTGKPILLCEFGYISGGAPKTKQEKLEIIQSYGAKDKKDAIANVEKFLDNMPERMSKYVKKCAQTADNYASYIFKSEFTNHFYRELPKTCLIPGYPHTSEGQAKFYKDIIPRLYNLNFVCGIIIYCWQDSDKCYVCGQSDCPTETRWGLVDMNEKEKPSYYAVRDELNKIK